MLTPIASPPGLAPPALASLAVVANPPPALRALPVGSRLLAVVLTQAAPGVAQVHTAAGTVDLQTPVPFAPGSTLALVLKATAPRFELHITAIGRPPADPPPPPTSSPPSAASGAPPSSPPALPTALSQISAGTRLIATLAAPAQWMAAPDTRTPGAAAAPTLLAAGSKLPLAVVTVAPPGATTASSNAAAAFEPTAFASGRVIAAMVIGNDATGRPIVGTSAGILTVPTAALPRGTVLTVEIAGPAQPPLGPTPSPVARVASMATVDIPWPALAEGIAALRATDRSTTQRLLETVLPRPDSRLTAALLFFLSALRGGQLRGWLGDDAVRALERAHPDLASRFASEFQRLGGGDEVTARDWRITPMPMFGDGEITPVRLWLRRGNDSVDDGTGGADRTSRGRRFVVDVTLSRLGRLQLDGLVGERGRRLDLIVRSESPLPLAMRDHIRGLFADASAFTGLGGAVGFQAAPPGFVDDAAAVSSARTAGVLV